MPVLERPSREVGAERLGEGGVGGIAGERRSLRSTPGRERVPPCLPLLAVPVLAFTGNAAEVLEEELQGAQLEPVRAHTVDPLAVIERAAQRGETLEFGQRRRSCDVLDPE